MKKILSVILVFVLLIPAGAFAEGIIPADSVSIGPITNGSEIGTETIEFAYLQGRLILASYNFPVHARLEIVEPGVETPLFSDSISSFRGISVEEGMYHLSIDYETATEKIFYYGFLHIDSNEVSADLEKVCLTKGESGEYQINANITEAEPNDSRATATTIQDDDNAYGYITSTTDVDWYRVSFSFDGYVNFWLGNLPDGTNYNLEIYNATGTLLGSSITTASYELVTLNPTTKNTIYYIKVYGHGGSYDAFENYLVRAKFYFDPNNMDYTYYGTLGWDYMYDENGPFTYISSAYGPRNLDFVDSDIHCGFDIAGSGIAGADIHNVFAGTCVAAAEGTAEGYYVVVRTNSIDPITGSYLYVHYKHMQAPSTLTSGTVVSAGTVVGKTGNTGTSSGAHLHFQVNNTSSYYSYSFETTLNPILFFPDVEFTGNTNVYLPTSTTAELMNSVSTVDPYANPYYRIYSQLYLYVGIDAYENWKENLESTEEKNVWDFLNDFEISKSVFVELMGDVSDIYDADVIYESENVLKPQNEVKVTLTGQENSNVFVE